MCERGEEEEEEEDEDPSPLPLHESFCSSSLTLSLNSYFTEFINN